MPALIAAIALVIALLLAVVFGPLLEMWAWGPALLALVVACVPALWSLVRGGGGRTPGWLVWLGLASVGWFGWRALSSPVADYGVADGLLMLGAVGAFVVVTRSPHTRFVNMSDGINNLVAELSANKAQVLTASN